MKKLICIGLSLILVLTLFCGCAAERMKDSASLNAAPMESGAYDKEAFYQADEVVMATEASKETAESQSVAANRKLIRKLSLHAETENYTELLTQIENHVFVCGGYIESMEANTRYSSSSRYANLTIRVPADKLDEFAGYVGEVSNIVYRSESSQDITTTYVDTQSRRDALKTEHDRLLELLEQAKSLDEILRIENRLTEVRYQLQNIESQLRTYDNLVDYATITLNISEVEVYTVVEEKGFWEELGDGFMKSLKGAWMVLTDAFAFAVIAFPYLLLAAIIPVAALSILLIRRRKQRTRNTNTQQDPQ